MKFRTKEGETAYREVLDDVSARSIRMYDEVKRIAVMGSIDEFQLNLAVEQFQHPGLSKAIDSRFHQFNWIRGTWPGCSFGSGIYIIQSHLLPLA